MSVENTVDNTSEINKTSENAGGTGGSATSENITFNEGITQLEQIINSLESGQLELEDSLGKYEQGVKLLRMLQQKIATAEQKVTVLLGEIEPESSDSIDTKLS